MLGLVVWLIDDVVVIVGQVFEQFFVSNSIECISLLEVVYASRFSFESLGDHFVHSVVDALIELLTRSDKPYLDDAEWTLFLHAGSK